MCKSYRGLNHHHRPCLKRYEITRYGSLAAFAKFLKYNEAEKILRSILDQEKAADKKLSELAEDRIDFAAAAVPSEASA